MNNLLQSLSNHRLKLHVPDGDLKRLLSSVKEGRGHDAKLADAFYDALEGVLLDLRAVTIDNRDAEAFLKPVSKTDYPDYYEIIKDPMDLQTMLKKVKQKQYKSKIEFADDLELIWSNCSVYNTGDNHPLRLCASRLQEKANRLLKNVTDRRDRLDPPVPVDIPRTNGIMLNGHSRQHSTPPLPRSRHTSTTKQTISKSVPPSARRETSFAETAAFVRTATGMSMFLELDRDLESIAGPSNRPDFGRNPSVALSEKLFRFVNDRESEEESYGTETVNGDIGEKRKLAVNGDYCPRKKARTRSRERKPADLEPIDLWWEASTSSALMANGVPTLAYASSSACEQRYRQTDDAQSPHRPKVIKRRKKKRPPEGGPDNERVVSRSLLGQINNNIRTLKRVRQTHDKFLALNLNAGGEEGSGGPGAGGGAGPSGQGGFGSVEPPERPRVPSGLAIDDDDDEGLEVTVDERPWRSRGTNLEVGEEDADECLQWMSGKVLEHSGFQSTSKAALDVFTGVAEEYLFNVGRTLRYLCDKYSQQMSPEEIILHTLFESGITHVRDLERYITDDVIRYGSRLTDLEKKLVNAYTEVTAVDALDDDAFFGIDDDEEDGELVMGNFADSFGDDFLGLRELGIASELGLQSLTIPKKLLKGKHKQRNAQDVKPTEPPPPYPPPPQFVPIQSSQVEHQIGLLKPFLIQRFNECASHATPPLPPPFIRPPQRTDSKPSARPVPPARALSPVSSLEMQLMGNMGRDPALDLEQELEAQLAEAEQAAETGQAGLEGTGDRGPIPNPAAMPIMLPDDSPNPARTKIGPLGQIQRPSVSASAAKKKVKAKEASGPGPGANLGGGGSGDGSGVGSTLNQGILQLGGFPPSQSQLGKKSTSPKKKPDALLPPVIVASV